MLAKPFRFHGHGSVRRAYRQGRAVRNELGSLHVFADSKDSTPHVAVVVSKKVNKSAVARNRIRRRVYEIVRTHPDHQNSSSSLVFTVYLAEAETMPAEKLKNLVYALLNKG